MNEVLEKKTISQLLKEHSEEAIEQPAAMPDDINSDLVDDVQQRIKEESAPIRPLKDRLDEMAQDFNRLDLYEDQTASDIHSQDLRNKLLGLFRESPKQACVYVLHTYNKYSYDSAFMQACVWCMCKLIAHNLSGRYVAANVLARLIMMGYLPEKIHCSFWEITFGSDHKIHKEMGAGELLTYALKATGDLSEIQWLISLYNAMYGIKVSPYLCGESEFKCITDGFNKGNYWLAPYLISMYLGERKNAEGSRFASAYKVCEIVKDHPDCLTHEGIVKEIDDVEYIYQHSVEMHNRKMLMKAIPFFMAAGLLILIVLFNHLFSNAGIAIGLIGIITAMIGVAMLGNRVKAKGGDLPKSFLEAEFPNLEFKVPVHAGVYSTEGGV